MNAIAERAGVSKANLFHHFQSKDALYLTVVRSACDNASERLQQLSEAQGSLQERLKLFAQSQLNNLFDHADVSRLILRELLRDGEERGREFAEKVFGENFSRLVEILRAGQARGELRADADPAMLATLLIAANVFFFQSQGALRHLKDVTFVDQPKRYGEMLTDLLLHGALAPDKKKG